MSNLLTRFRNSSIRTKYLLAVAVLIVTVSVCCLYIFSHTFSNTYATMEANARTDFQTRFAELERFEDRLNHLATLFQSDSTIIGMLAGSQSYSAQDYQHARQDLLPKLYSMLDGSDDYFCRLYVDSALDLSDHSSRLLMLNNVLDQPWAMEVMEGWGWRRFYSAQALEAEDPALIVPIRRLDDYPTLVAILRIDIRQQALQRMLAVPEGNGYMLCYLETAEGECIAATGEAVSFAAELTDQQATGFQSYELNEIRRGRDKVFFQRLERSGWRLVTVLQHQPLMASIVEQFSFTFLFAIGLLTAGMLCSLPLLWHTTARIRRFCQHVRASNLQTDGLHITPERLTPQAEDEIGILVREHNAMLDRIDSLIQEQNQSREEMRQLEITALQAQIKPHFLYNTLEAIAWMARLNQPEKVESTVYNLTRFYRLCLSRGADVLTLDKELEIVRHYFAIASSRYESKYTLRMAVDDSVLALELPKITLQPLVENALMHGLLESGQEEGEVRLYTRRSAEGRWQLCVADTGGHFPAARWEQVMSDTSAHASGSAEGYGLRNVERRLCLFFDMERALQLEHGEDGLTILVVPLTR
ncbi:MAG: sensor histidine kinase [Aristaeellaceae bacterium]